MPIIEGVNIPEHQPGGGGGRLGGGEGTWPVEQDDHDGGVSAQ